MLIFFDVETTGLESSDRIIETGIIGDGICFTERIKPADRKISSAAMAVHHITNEAIFTCKRFEASESKTLLDALNDADNTLVSHNVAFDTMMLSREGYTFKGDIVDTLRCTKHLIKELESYALQYLRYELELYKFEKEFFKSYNVTINSHSALSDALHVKMLYEYLLNIADSKLLKQLSNQMVLEEKFSFGKYKDRFIEEICMIDRGYIVWMLNSLSDIDEDLRYSLEYYLENAL